MNILNQEKLAAILRGEGQAKARELLMTADIEAIESHKMMSWTEGHMGWTGTQDISDYKGREIHFFQRIYADAADVGFKLRSSKTGVEKYFYLADTNIQSGEITSWFFVEFDPKANKDGSTHIVIHND